MIVYVSQIINVLTIKIDFIGKYLNVKKIKNLNLFNLINSIEVEEQALECHVSNSFERTYS